MTLDLLLVPSLSLVTLIQIGSASHTPIVSNAVIEDGLWAHVPIIKFILDICDLVFG